MRISVILAHPDKESFNHAIAKTVIEQLSINNHDINFHDLYEEMFDPILPADEIPDNAILTGTIKTHCDEISSADGIVVVHPNWWGQPPAILKGWIDRVIRPGVAYRFMEGDNGEGVPAGLLKAEKAVILNTSNTDSKREISEFGDPLQLLWENCIFNLCGVKNFYRKMFTIIVTSTHKQRAEWLSEVQNIIDKSFPSSSIQNVI
ncbi:MAG: NAD(P)H-dependent oxidoreductase [Desulfobacterales bacterium]|jgi:NAD(P)H dehydrogenase (quinone)|nr:NAD(P)H-dependent oxidoreductase [Desulfobacteraceae bacterium]MBT4363644.1 NAD(P)H-dependent oxidoreductase [Desulfobacteraceae bacterium]MBT7086101.1 NAD(P)H-dependent oxidoreductase [Desulfobacterales bacterium]MBT7697848.1 NAD(P)H-dependent oxidoreductase [Desulfobacterales bacterium]